MAADHFEPAPTRGQRWSVFVPLLLLCLTYLAWTVFQTTQLVAKLNAEIARILKLPDVITFLNSQGTTPMGNSPQETRKWLTDETARWTKVINESGFKLEQ